MKRILLFVFILCSLAAFPQDSIHKKIFLSLDSINAREYLLTRNWAFSPSDDSSMALPSYDDSKWTTRSTTLSFKNDSLKSFNGICWFRLHVITDSTLNKTPLALSMTHYGASEIYFDGTRIQTFGRVNVADSSVYYDPQRVPFFFVIPYAGEHVLAVRYANHNAEKNYQSNGTLFAGFRLDLGDAYSFANQKNLTGIAVSFTMMLLCGIFAALSLLHLLMFLYNRRGRSNLSFSIFMFCLAAACIMGFIEFITHDPALELNVKLYSTVVFCMACMSLSGFINELFAKKKTLRFYIITTVAALIIFFRFSRLDFWDLASLALLIYVSIEAIVMIVIALIKRVKGARIIGAGVLFFALFTLTVFGISFTQGGGFEINDSTPEGRIFLGFLVFAILSIPLSMSVYQAWNFASVNKDLALQLEQVKILSQKTIVQEQEKQRLLESRKEELEKEVQQRTSELRESHQQLMQQEKLASLGQLTAGIAHEIKNPLNFVTNFSELSNELIQELDTASSEEEKKEILAMLKNNLEKINYHGKRADSIVKNMLEHSRGKTGEKQLTDINQLCDEFFNLAYHGMRATHPGFNCEMKKSYATDLPKVNIVSQDISRVLLNLFNNAFYAVLKRGEGRGTGDEKNYQPTVTLTTSSTDKRVTIKVRDNGTGIPADIKDKIFNPFFTTKPTGQGTGLGLSISYDIITKGHNGDLHVDSKSGEFTEFTITIPVS